jgi:Mg-chelatase subunit ChlD
MQIHHFSRKIIIFCLFLGIFGLQCKSEMAPKKSSPARETATSSAPSSAASSAVDMAAPSSVAKPTSAPPPPPASMSDKVHKDVMDSEPPRRQPIERAGLLTAGEWNDNEHESFWNDLMNGQSDWQRFKDYWKMYPTKGISLTINDLQGNRIQDVKLVVESENGNILFEGRTDNFGKAFLFPNFAQERAHSHFRIKAIYQDQTMDLGKFSLQDTEIHKEINVVKKLYNNADIMLVVDATGSMGDEIAYLQAELGDVVTKVKQQHSNNLNIRLGSVFYRDKTDNYVTRPLPFTTDLNTMMSFLKQQSAGGGGDFPEAVDAALESALQQQWSENAVARILFLVLDAPPHQDEQGVVEKMQKYTQLAAKKGIKIIPIVASGIDKPTEFLMRFMAKATNGTYIFITDDSGIGNSHLKPTVGNYKVEPLNELMIRVLDKYLKTTNT